MKRELLRVVEPTEVRHVTVSVEARFQDMGQTAANAYVEAERAKHVEPVRIQEQTKRLLRGLAMGAEVMIFAVTASVAPEAAFLPVALMTLVAVAATAGGALDGLEKLFSAIAERIKPKL